MEKIVFLVLTLVVLSSCSLGANYNGYTLSCQGAGCDAYTDHLAGVIDVTKTPSNEDSEHYKLRELQASKPSLLQGLFSKGGN